MNMNMDMDIDAVLPHQVDPDYQAWRQRVIQVFPQVVQELSKRQGFVQAGFDEEENVPKVLIMADSDAERRAMEIVNGNLVDCLLCISDGSSWQVDSTVVDDE